MAGCADHAVYSPECRAFRGLLQWPAKNFNGLAEPTSRVLRRAGGTAGWQGPRARRATAQQHRRRCHRGGMGIRTGSSPPFGQPPPPNRVRSRAFSTARDYARLRIPTHCARRDRGHAARHSACVHSLESQKTGRCKEINTSRESRWGWC